MERTELVKLIDHTLLRATATVGEIDTLCGEAINFSFATVCVNPCHVSTASRRLQGTDVGVCTVVGFPLGATLSAVKAYETREVIQAGATEVDMVIAVHALKSGLIADVKTDIRAVVSCAGDIPVKVILETCLLTDDEIAQASELAADAGAAFVKTSTGFGGGGATVEHVALMRRVVGDALGVKASGGIRDYAKAVAMVEAGANRLGCSAGVAIASGTLQSGPAETY